jgi:tRNA pseudouridine55 synthase
MSENFGGVVCIKKEAGYTSHDVVNKIRRLYNTRQVGHTGTLDPMATGVLVVMVGRAVKASELLTLDTKEYVATLKLGITTDTEDISGQVLDEYKGDMPDFETVKNAVLTFTGEIFQVPPMYSALKISGKKLVDLARKGQEIERQPRAVCVEKIEVFETDKADEFLLCTRVSKGTYIRTLCADIGKKLGTGAVMATLTRTCCGDFGIEDALTLAEIEEMTEEQRNAALKPVEELFSDCGCAHLTDFFAKLASCGCEIYQKKIGTHFLDGELVRLYDDSGFFAIGRVQNFESGSAIKPIKQFRVGAPSVKQ